MIKAENKVYIKNLKISDVPWHRLTTAYGRAIDFPVHFEILHKMDDLELIKTSFYELTTNMEHQGTLWHATPFGMIFMNRILIEVLHKSTDNNIADFLVDKILEFFDYILQCYHEGDEMEHANPIPLFSDMLQEKYLWSEEYDEDEDEMRYEEEVFSDNLFYSFYYYSQQSILVYKESLEQYKSTISESKITHILDAL